MSLITNLKLMYSIKRWYDIWDVVKTPNVDIMIIGKKYIPETNKFLYLIPTPDLISCNLIWINEKDLDTYNINNN